MTTHKELTAGAYPISAEMYHADPCPQPSLSRTAIKDLVTRSPAHAWVNHPRLNPNHEPQQSGRFDLGHAFEDVLLRGGTNLAVVAFDDWRTTAAKQQRDEAHAANKTPVLAKDADRVVSMVAACRQQLEHHDPAIVGSLVYGLGVSEEALIWQEDGAWCRALLDWRPNDNRVFIDVKTTSTKATADGWGRSVFWDTGCDIQAAWYLRAIRKVLDVEDATFAFLVVEVDPPHAMSVMIPDRSTLHIGEAKVERGLELWRWCMKHDRWPAYPREAQLISPSPWQMALHEDAQHEAADERKRFDGDLLQRLVDWQAP